MLFQSLADDTLIALQDVREFHGEHFVREPEADLLLQVHAHRGRDRGIQQRLELDGVRVAESGNESVAKTTSHCCHVRSLLKLKFLTAEGVLPDDLVSDLASFLRRRTA